MNLLLSRLPLLGLIVAFQATAMGQTLPDVSLKDMDGNAVNTQSLLQEEGPTVFCFWATWCSPCKRELNNYAELYDDWVD